MAGRSESCTALLQIPKFQLGLGLSMEFTEPEREKLGIYAPEKEPEREEKKGI